MSAPSVAVSTSTEGFNCLDDRIASLRDPVLGRQVLCQLVLTEVPRAIRRGAQRDPRLPLDLLIARAVDTIDALALLPVDRGLLAAAGALAEPALRALDAIHVAAAASISRLDAFVSYDERQAAAARLAGIRTQAPGS